MKRGSLERSSVPMKRSSLARRGFARHRAVKSIENIEKDEKFYEEIWNEREHVCEECGLFLGDEFRNDNDKIINRWRFSHILSKGAYPQLRRDKRNMNLLCLDHHSKWENGNKRSMLIYGKNKESIDIMLKEIADGKV